MSTEVLEQNASLVAKAAEIRRLGKQTIDSVIEIGRLLVECKEEVGHGNFCAWIQLEFNWSDETARRFMQVFEFSKNHNLWDLNLPLSSLYLLSTPANADVRDEVLEEIQKLTGHIKGEDVKSAIQKAKANSPTTDAAYDEIKRRAREGTSLSRKKLAKETGISERAIQNASKRIKEETSISAGTELDFTSCQSSEIADINAVSAPQENISVIDVSLPPTYQQRVDTAIRSGMKRMAIEFESRVSEEVLKGTEKYLKMLLRREEDAIRRSAAYKGVMTSEEFRTVIRCLHPDFLPRDIDDEKRRMAHEAFRVMMGKKKDGVLTKPEPEELVSSMPKTVEELMARRKPTKSKTAVVQT